MAIAEVVEVSEKEGSVDALRRSTHVRNFLVETNDPLDGDVPVRTASDPVTHLTIPVIGATYSVHGATDPYSFVQSLALRCLSASPNPSHSLWQVTATYGPYDSGQFGIDVTAWPIKCSWGAVSYERVCYEDAHGDPVVNSAGQLFADPLVRDDDRPVLTVLRNERVDAYSDTLADTYRDTVNKYVWNGYPAKTVKCKSITTSEPQFNAGSGWYYFAVTYVFEFDRDTFAKEIVDQGFSELDPTTGKLKKINDEDGQPFSEPQNLDGSGAPLPVGDPTVFLTIDLYEEKDFAVFNIDLSTQMGR